MIKMMFYTIRNEYMIQEVLICGGKTFQKIEDGQEYAFSQKKLQIWWNKTTKYEKMIKMMFYTIRNK